VSDSPEVGAWGTASCPEDYPVVDSQGFPPDVDDLGLSAQTLGVYSYGPLRQAEIVLTPFPGFESHEVLAEPVEPAAHPGYEDSWRGDIPVVRCVNVARHPEAVYLAGGHGVDVHGRDVSFEPTVLGAVTPEGRPLAVATRDVGDLTGAINRFSIRAWSRARGHVRLVDGPCDYGPRAATPGEGVEDLGGNSVSGSPVANADPAFDERWSFVRQVEPGETRRVCVYVYDSDDPFDIVGADELVLHSIDVLRPTLSREITAGDPEAVEALTVSIGGVNLRHGSTFTPDPYGGFGPLVLEQRRPNPATNRDFLATSEHRGLGGWEACAESGCVPRSEWFQFAIPRPEGLGGGVVSFRVDYELVFGTDDGRRLGGWGYADADSVPDSDSGFVLRFDRPGVDSETLRTSVDVTVLSPVDRAFSVISWEAPGSRTPVFPSSQPVSSHEVRLAGELATEVTIRAEGLWPGLAYDFYVAYLDADGNEVLSPVVGTYVPSPVQGTLQVEVEIETLDQPRAGIRDLEVRVEDFSRNLGVSCVEPSGTFDVIDGPAGISGQSLTVAVSLNNPAAGEDCWGTPSGNEQIIRFFQWALNDLPGCGLQSRIEDVVGTGSPLQVTVRAGFCPPPAIGGRSQ
jgi:hypothetical protein